jgi:ankyrin repeat protein
MTRASRILPGVLLFLLGAAVVFGQSPAGADRAEALAEAARKGDAAAVKKLLDEGVDVNTKFRYGATALSYACDRGHLDAAKLLMDRGADVNVRDTFYKATPLTWAVSPAMGRTPQHPEIVRLLLEHGAQGKEQAFLGAVSEPDVATTKVILDSGGISPDLLSDALDAAQNGKQADLVALLERAGAKPRVEFKIDDAQLALYAGTYRGPREAELVIGVAAGRLIGDVPGQHLIFVARDATTFGVTGAPGAVLTIRLEGGKVVSIGFPSSAVTWTRVESK